MTQPQPLRPVPPPSGDAHPRADLLRRAFDDEDAAEAARACMRLAAELTIRAAKLVGANPAIASAPGFPLREQATEGDGEVRFIPSKYPGRCRICGDTYAQGDRIAWIKGVKGAAHQRCFDNQGGPG